MNSGLPTILAGIKAIEFYGYLPKTHEAYKLIADALLGMYNVRLRDRVVIHGIDLGSIRGIDEFCGLKPDATEVYIRTLDLETLQNDLSYLIPSAVFSCPTIEEGMRLARAGLQIEILRSKIAHEQEEHRAKIAELNRKLALAQRIVDICIRSSTEEKYDRNEPN